MNKTNKPYWIHHGFLPQAEWLESLPDDVDTIILGAGVAGLYTGVELAFNTGKNSYILDISIPGTRSAIKSDGILFIGQQETPKEIISKKTTPKHFKSLSLSIDNFKLFEKFLKKYSKTNWCEYSNFGGIRIANSKEQADALKQYVKLYQHFDMKATWLSPMSFQNITGIRWSDGAIYVPNEGVFNPNLFVNGLVNANRAIGNKIISGFHFGNLTQLQDGKVLVSDIYGNVIQANRVIVCLGAFSHNTSIPILQQNIQPTRVQYIATPKIDSSKVSLPPYAFSIDNGNEYFRIHNSRVIFGGGNNDIQGEVKEIGIMADAKVNDYLSTVLMGIMAYRISFLNKKDAEAEYIWTRNVCTTPDGLPIVGKLKGWKNVYLNTGYGAHGISYEMIGSKIISELISYNKTKIYGSELLSPNRL